MAQNDVNLKLIAYFNDLFRDTRSIMKFKQAHDSLSDLIELLVVQEDFISKLNHQVGLLNIEAV